METFIAVAMEGPDPSEKYQFPEWSKLHQVVSLLVRCCDVSSKCQSAQSALPPAPNPYAECSDYLMPIQPSVADLLFAKTG